MNSFKEAPDGCKEIDFQNNHIVGCYLENAHNLKILAPSIVINVGSVPAVIEGEPVKTIASQKSTILQNTTILSGVNLIIVEVKERENVGSVILQKGWKTAEELFGKDLKGVPLWRSSPEEIGKIILDPYEVTGSRLDKSIEVFSISVNLWFATEKTDCGIHNHSKNNFIEFHTQIIGTGRMQKFKAKTKETLYEEQFLAEGNSHDIFCGTEENLTFSYPWHQYYANTDCIWLVVELHHLKLHH